MKRLIQAAALATTLVGCTTPSPPLERPPFPQAEYDALLDSGTALVTGQAFLKTRGGDVKTAAGNPVYLNPMTSYSQWAYNNRFAPSGLGPANPRLRDFMYETIADASGRFTFKNVPPGHYYLTASVTWEAPMGGTLVRQGGPIWKEITVKDGEVKEVIVTQ